VQDVAPSTEELEDPFTIKQAVQTPYALMKLNGFAHKHVLTVPDYQLKLLFAHVHVVELYIVFNSEPPLFVAHGVHTVFIT
jgi:hypothetical protein